MLCGTERFLPPRIARVRAAVAAFARLMHRPASELPAHQGFIIQQMRRLRRTADRPVRQNPVKHPFGAPLPRKERLRSRVTVGPRPLGRMGAVFAPHSARPRLVVAVTFGWLLIATAVWRRHGGQRRACGTLYRGAAAVR